ncbi:MAG: NUDIX domain-containing protein [bacterium]|nr:NUDIX domain-containing protein [bacterium]
MMNTLPQYKRLVQTSVTNFLHCGDEYLFMERHPGQWINAGEMNGIGGRLEPGENYLDAAIRETKEEIGLNIDPKQIELCGILKIDGGYDEDWVVGIFRISISSKNLPVGDKTLQGDALHWIHKNKVLTENYKLVDDIRYIFNDVAEGNHLFFMNAVLDENKKIKSHTYSKIARQIK